MGVGWSQIKEIRPDGAAGASRKRLAAALLALLLGLTRLRKAVLRALTPIQPDFGRAITNPRKRD